MTSSSSADLQPSKLGTKEHWDQVYEDELTNFKDFGDEGEIWFGADSIEKMVEWATQNVPASANPNILEVGSGNGSLLVALLDEGYPAQSLCGIDYSAGAIELSKAVAATRDGEDISFSTCDFLTEDPPVLSSMTDIRQRSDVWDLLLDKGTYDAIALGEQDTNGNSPASRYPSRAARLIKSGGFFLITSCNFTEEELKANFATKETGLQFHSRIKYPTITFGGKSGAIYSSVAFKKI